MSDMIERVAEAMHDVDDARSNPAFRVKWDACVPAYKEMLREQAIAAIKAMREPTDEMLAAASPSESNRLLAKALYRAMLASILSTQPQEEG